MARSSITGGERAPTQADGRDVEALGPSDTSDSGSDVQGVVDLASPLDLDDGFRAAHPGLQSESDSGGTGERGAALPGEQAVDGGDIMPDDIRSLAEEAGESEDVAAMAELELGGLVDDDVMNVDADADADDAEDDPAP